MSDFRDDDIIFMSLDLGSGRPPAICISSWLGLNTGDDAIESFLPPMFCMLMSIVLEKRLENKIIMIIIIIVKR